MQNSFFSLHTWPPYFFVYCKQDNFHFAFFYFTYKYIIIFFIIKIDCSHHLNQPNQVCVVPFVYFLTRTVYIWVSSFHDVLQYCSSPFNSYLLSDSLSFALHIDTEFRNITFNNFSYFYMCSKSLTSFQKNKCWKAIVMHAGFTFYMKCDASFI